MVDNSLPAQVSFHHDTKLADLEIIRQYIERRSALLQVNSSKTYDIDLAVTELVTNSLVHGYPQQQGWIEVDMERQDNKIIVKIRDRAQYFDPTQHPEPDLSVPLHKRPPGGLGIHLTRLLVQEMAYRSLPGGGNETTLVFTL